MAIYSLRTKIPDTSIELLLVISEAFDITFRRNATGCFLAYCYRRSVCVFSCVSVHLCVCTPRGGPEENGLR